MTEGSQTTEIRPQDDVAKSKDLPPLPAMWMQWWGEWIEVIQACQAFPGAVANWRKDQHYVMKMRPHSQDGYPDITGCTD